MSETTAWILGGILVAVICLEFFYGLVWAAKINESAHEDLDLLYLEAGHWKATPYPLIQISTYSYHGGFVWRNRIRHDAKLTRTNARTFVRSMIWFNLRWAFWTASPISVGFALVHNLYCLRRIGNAPELECPIAETQKQLISIAVERTFWLRQIG